MASTEEIKQVIKTLAEKHGYNAMIGIESPEKIKWVMVPKVTATLDPEREDSRGTLNLVVTINSVRLRVTLSDENAPRFCGNLSQLKITLGDWLSNN